MAELTHDCGASYPAGALLCPGCGGTLGLEPPTTPSAPMPVPPAGAQPVPAGTCPDCGRSQPVLGDACVFCGSPLAATAPRPEEVLLGLPGGSSVPLPDGMRIVLGRESDDPVVRGALSLHDAVSRRHTELVRTGDRLLVRDLGSTNGTIVDGQPVVGSTEIDLRDGAVIGLGLSTRVQIAPVEQGARP